MPDVTAAAAAAEQETEHRERSAARCDEISSVLVEMVEERHLAVIREERPLEQRASGFMEADREDERTSDVFGLMSSGRYQILRSML